MALRERLAPPVLELVHKVLERKPFMIELRRKLVAGAAGRVLEVGAGPGFNLPYYPGDVEEVVLTDDVAGMLHRAERRARVAAASVTTRQAPVERLPFEDASFDTVVASLLLCSVDDQDRALAEIRRVLRPGGQYLFLEHVRSEVPRIAGRQDALEPIWRVIGFGCHPNRATLSRIEAAFRVEDVERGELPAGPKIVRPYVLGRAMTFRS
ncbi:MAG TPA: class I SAM-dependent methyltransferase [Gaiellaceae bacterium]|nr:class I SAM-dependent methyltransferase [Gaiellaceae bacterium]